MSERPRRVFSRRRGRVVSQCVCVWVLVAAVCCQEACHCVVTGHVVRWYVKVPSSGVGPGGAGLCPACLVCC